MSAAVAGTVPKTRIPATETPRRQPPRPSERLTRPRFDSDLRRFRPTASYTTLWDATQWAHVGTALALWMLLPLLIGTWRITRREVSV